MAISQIVEDLDTSIQGVQTAITMAFAIGLAIDAVGSLAGGQGQHDGPGGGRQLMGSTGRIIPFG